MNDELKPEPETPVTGALDALMSFTVYMGGNLRWRAELHLSERRGPWFNTKAGAAAWALVQLDRLAPLVEAGYQITGVTRRCG